MNSNTRRILVLALGTIAILSSLAVLANGPNSLPGSAYTASPYQSAFEQSMSTGSPVQMQTENYSAVQNALSNYNLALMPENQSLSFFVNFNVVNQTRLLAYINQEVNPFSPYFHKFLTSSDFGPGSQYGPSLAAYNDAMQYYTKMGFTVTKEYNLGIQFTGTASQVNSAFNTSMITFKDNGVAKYANYRAISLPKAFASSISSVDGLTNLLMYQPDSMISHSASPAGSSTMLTGGSGVNTYLSQSNVLNFSRHSFAWANVPGYGLTQFLFPTTMPLLYNATGLINHGGNGKNVTIAVVMEQGYNPSDLATYASEVFGNPGQILNRITNYPVNGASVPSNNTFLNYSYGGAGEFTLDLQYSSTMAPNANIDAVYGPDLYTMSLDMVYNELSGLYTKSHQGPQVVTNSWGGDEDIWWNLYGPSYQNAFTMESLFEVLTSEGATILFSSGDSAGVGYLTNFLSGSWGATSPFTIGVGGVRTVATSALGPFPTGNVSNFTLSPVSNQTVGMESGLWLPNYSLDVANATGIYSQSYWYTPNLTGSVPFAGGQVGLSYWFNQSAYQHGPNVPNAGRQNSVDISGEADFNMTEYFAGMWVFFWGGTSFACPTVAGELADIISYLNLTNHVSAFGLFNPVLYEIGNFQNLFGNSPYYSVSNGSNPWAAANQGVGWPNNLSYPAGWTQEKSGYTLLTGWGTINAYNFAMDLEMGFTTFLNTIYNATAGAPLYSISSGIDSGHAYVFSVLGYERNGTNMTNISFQPGATVNITVYDNNGGVVSYLNATADKFGNFTFDTTGLGGDTFTVKITNATNVVSYWYAYINNVSATGTLNVTVLQSNVMGGLAGYNDYLSSGYPGFAPLMPNTVEVSVTLNGNPVQNAYVYAQQENYTALYNDVNQFNTSYRSVGFTNASGIAFVETWNVADNVTYYVNATYDGLMNSTTLNVTPQYFTFPIASLPLIFGPFYMGMVFLPGVTPGTSYTLPMAVDDHNLSMPLPANISIGYKLNSTNGVLQNMMPTISVGPNGLYNLTINDSLTPGLYFINITIPGEQMTYYNGMPLYNPSTYIPLFIEGEYGGTFMPVSFNGSMQSYYIGRNASISGTLNATDPIDWNSTNGPLYWFDNNAPQVYPVGINYTTNSQSNLLMDVPIPSTLPLGFNTFTVSFYDSYLNLTYYTTTDFYIISNSESTVPVTSMSVAGSSAYIAQSGTDYYTGTVTFNLTNSESDYSTATIEITNTAGTVNLVSNVTGASSFSYDFSNLAGGTYDVTYQVINYNGEEINSSLIIHAQVAYSVTFTESGLPSGTSWNVTFNGVTVNSTTSTITFNNVLPGSYTYSISNVSGYSVTGGSAITVSGSGNVNVAFAKIPATVPSISTTALIYIIGGTVGGLVVGALVVYFLRRPKV